MFSGKYQAPRPMLLLQRRVLSEVIAVFVVAFVVVTGMILLAATVIFLRKFSSVELRDVLHVLPLLGAHMSVYTVPLTVLFAVIWTFSRLLQDNEITAMRSCGVHLHTITAPVVLFGLVVTATMLMMFDQVIPLAHRQKKDLLRRTVVSRINRIRAGESNRLSLGSHEIFVRNIDYDEEGKGVLEDVIIYQVRSSGDMAPRHRFVVPRAKLAYDRVTGVMRLRLMGGHYLVFSEQPAEAESFERTFERYVFELPLEPYEIERARRVADGGAGRVGEVEFVTGRLRFARRGGQTEGGRLEDVTLLVRPPASELRCDRVEVWVELSSSPSLIVSLADSDSARRRTRAGNDDPLAAWEHVFRRQEVIPLDRAGAARWQELLSEPERGLEAVIEHSGLALVGRVEVRGEGGRLVLGDGRVTIQREPSEIEASVATVEVSTSFAGDPVLRLDLERGRVLSRRSWGTSPARLDIGEFVDLYLSLDPGSARSVRLADMPFADLYRAYLKPLPERTASQRARTRFKDSRLLTEIHYRYALAFASLFFVLVAAPAAMILRASSRTAAFGITLLKVFLLYFPAVVGTKALCASGVLDAHPQWIPVILWSGNIVFGVLAGLYFIMLHRR